MSPPFRPASPAGVWDELAQEDYLQLSGLQHFAFCRRQWALIHIENQWAENYRTVDGHLMHERVHDQELRESRGNRLTVRGLAVHSARLGVSGQCDAVEFFKAPAGVPLRGAGSGQSVRDA